tara:strand:+ start:66 stop:404 length:339 start_codon:yes stop_codon:yes gene_type:complete
MSSSLNWSDAEKMLKAYQKNSKALIANPPQGTEILKGFTIERTDIKAIMDNSEVADVFVMPAVNLSDLNKPDAQQVFTVILVGLDAAGDIVENSAVDFLAPCPVQCPKNYPK